MVFTITYISLFASNGCSCFVIFSMWLEVSVISKKQDLDMDTYDKPTRMSSWPIGILVLTCGIDDTPLCLIRNWIIAYSNCYTFEIQIKTRNSNSDKLVLKFFFLIFLNHKYLGLQTSRSDKFLNYFPRWSQTICFLSSNGYFFN